MIPVPWIFVAGFILGVLFGFILAIRLYNDSRR